MRSLGSEGLRKSLASELLPSGRSALGEGGEFHDLAAGEGGFVGAEADAGPVGGLHRVDGALAIFDQRREKLVREVRV